MICEVIQFMRPDGRMKQLRLTIPDGDDGKRKLKYQLIRLKGCEITCEQLMNGAAAQYISHPLGDFVTNITPPYDIKAASNKLLEMIDSFDENEFDKWLKEVENEEKDNRNIR